jgi:hypothetical protein
MAADRTPAPPPLFPPLLREFEGGSCDKRGSGSYSSVWECRHAVVTRVVDYGPTKSLSECAERTRNTLSNIFGFASTFTEHYAMPTAVPGAGVMRTLGYQVGDAPPGTAESTLVRVSYFMTPMDSDLGTTIKRLRLARSVPRPVPAPSTRIRLATGLVRTLADLHAAGVFHVDIKPANILIKGEGGEERVALADFDSLFMERWVGQPAMMAAAAGSTPLYAVPGDKHRKRRTAAKSRVAAGDPYRGEVGTRFEGAWALMRTLMEFLVPHGTQNVIRASKASDRWVTELDTDELSLLIAQIGAEGYTERDAERVRELLRLVVAWGDSGKKAGVRAEEMAEFTANDMLARLTPAESSPRGRTWDTPATNPIAHVAQLGSWRAAVADAVLGDANSLQQRLLDRALADATEALRVNSGTARARCWAFLTLAGALSHALSLVAAYFVANRTATWPPAPRGADAPMLAYATYIAAVGALPQILDPLSEVGAREPIAVLHNAACAALGILPPLPPGAENFTRPEMRAAAEEWRTRATARDVYSVWKVVLRRLVNSTEHWFDSNVAVPCTLTLVTRALAGSRVWGDDRRNSMRIYVGVPEFYTAERLAGIRALLRTEGLDDVVGLHALANGVRPDVPYYTDVLGGTIKEEFDNIVRREAARAQAASREATSASERTRALAPTSTATPSSGRGAGGGGASLRTASA